MQDSVYRTNSNGVNHSLIWTNFDYLDLPEFKIRSEIFSSNTVTGNDIDWKNMDIPV